MIRGTEIKFGRAPRKDELESDYDIIRFDWFSPHNICQELEMRHGFLRAIQGRYQQGKEP